MTTDTEQTTRIRITRDMISKPGHTLDTGRHRSGLETLTGLGAAFLGGLLVAAAVDISTPFAATEFTFSLIRAIFVGAAIVAFIAWSTPRAVDDLCARVGEFWIQDRNATEDVGHRLDKLRGALDKVPDGLARLAEEVAECKAENARLRGLLEGRLTDVAGELTRVRTRMAEGTVDVVSAFEMGQETERQRQSQ